MSMLEYFKLILSKVSFDRKIFLKEYRKSKNWLNESELRELKFWLRKNKVLPAYMKAKKV